MIVEMREIDKVIAWSSLDVEIIQLEFLNKYGQVVSGLKLDIAIVTRLRGLLNDWLSARESAKEVKQGQEDNVSGVHGLPEDIDEELQPISASSEQPIDGRPIEEQIQTELENAVVTSRTDLSGRHGDYSYNQGDDPIQGDDPTLTDDDIPF